MRMLLALMIATLAVGACTTVPEPIQGDFPSISPARVEDGVFGQSVRWGGVIVNTFLEQDRTCFEILSRELDKYLRPNVEDYSAGRYVACKAGFLDPAVFTAGREVTTTGQIRNIRVGDIEGIPYRYPVLEVDSLVLWEKRRQVIVYRGFHDPWLYRYPWGYPYWGYGRPYPLHSSVYAEPRSLLPEPSIVNTGKSPAPQSSTEIEDNQ